MRKNYRKLVTIMLAFVMLFAMYVPSTAQQTITVSVKIRTTALNGAVLAQNNSVTLPEGSTALDALKAVVGSTPYSETTIDGVTYYQQGILKWRTSQYGNYAYAVAVSGHGSNANNKYFYNNGTANTSGTWTPASGNAYGCLSDLNQTESDLLLNTNSTFNNTVHETGYLSEFDYNNYSGWMMIINGNTYNLNCDTVLGNNDTIDLNFSMMMGLDLGQDSWMQDSSGDWVPVDAWNTYSF